MVDKDASTSSPQTQLGKAELISFNAILHAVETNMNKVSASYLNAPSETYFTERSKDCQLLIIIPVFGRHRHLAAVIECLSSQIKNLENPDSVSLLISEMDNFASHKELCTSMGVNYVWHARVCGEFNKSAAMNFAHKRFTEEHLRAPDYILFHDVDIIVDNGWVADCLRNAKDLDAQHGKSSGWVCQTIKERKVHYVSEDVTERFFAKDITVSDLANIEHGVSPWWSQGVYPPGGSIMINKPLLFATGGYDPFLFWGYSPEDRHFLQMTQVLAPNSLFPFKSDCKSYHLYHPHLEQSNMMLEHMVAMSKLIQIQPFLMLVICALKNRTSQVFCNALTSVDTIGMLYPFMTPGQESPSLRDNTFSKATDEQIRAISTYNIPLATLIASYRHYAAIYFPK